MQVGMIWKKNNTLSKVATITFFLFFWGGVVPFLLGMNVKQKHVFIFFPGSVFCCLESPHNWDLLNQFHENSQVFRAPNTDPASQGYDWKTREFFSNLTKPSLEGFLYNIIGGFN